MEYEIFKPIPDYEGHYEVSSLGRIRSLKRGKERLMKLGTNTHGRPMVFLYLNGKGTVAKVHQIVAAVFLGHTPCGMIRVIDHIDNNPLNNCVDNLQILSNRENCSKDRKGGTSRYVGVHFHRASNMWMAKIKIEGKQKYLGTFTDEIDAANSYKNALANLKENT